jgi:hypothetical protein
MTDRPETPENRLARASDGERVTICIETIKADKKAEFDHLLHDVLGPAGLEANGRVFAYTSLIEPSEANSDGTWSYVSILDPVIADGDYRVQHTLESKYGPAEGEKYAKAYQECYAAPVKVYRGAQAPWGRSRLQREAA